MSIVSRIETWKDDSDEPAMRFALNLVVRRVVLACGVVVGGFVYLIATESGTIDVADTLTSTGRALFGDYQYPLQDWAEANPRAVMSNMFRYPPSLLAAVRCMKDDGLFEFDVRAAVTKLPDSVKLLNDAWRRAAAPDELLAVEWETTTYEGEKSAMLISMGERKYAVAIIILCCHVQERLDADPRSGLAPEVDRADAPPRGYYDESRFTAFAPIGVDVE